jgi:hypothetical protein
MRWPRCPTSTRSSSTDSAVFTGKATTSRRERRPRRGGLPGPRGRAASRFPPPGDRARTPAARARTTPRWPAGGSRPPATGAPQPAAHRAQRTAQPRGDHAMPWPAAASSNARSSLGPVAPARHRPRRKQRAGLRARTADRPPGRSGQTARSIRTGRSRPSGRGTRLDIQGGCRPGWGRRSGRPGTTPAGSGRENDRSVGGHC